MTPVILPVPAESGFLANGLKYIIQSDNANPVVCLQLYIKIGSAWESPEEAGFAHFLEHLVFKSTRDFPANRIMQFVNSLGGSLNAFTDFDCTCFHISLPSEFLSEGLHVLSELALHPAFTARDVTLEKDIIIEELRESETDPEGSFLDFLQERAFKENPLRRPVLGTKRSVRSATSRVLRDFYQRYYQPGNAFVVACGDTGAEKLKTALEEFFGGWQDNQDLPHFDKLSFLEPEIPPEKEVFRKGRQEFIAYALPELADTHPASDALLVAIRYLAIGRSSRLFRRLVEEEQLCSSVKVTSYCGIMSGISAIVLNPTHNKHLERIQAVFDEEYNALREGRLDPAEVELVKKDIVNTWRYGFEGTENLANMLGAEEFISGYEKLYSYDETVNAIALEDVRESIERFWTPQFLSRFRQAPSDYAQTISRDTAARHGQTSVNQAFEEVGVLRVDLGTDAALPPIQKLDENYFTATLPNGFKFLYRRVPQRPITGFALAADVSQLSENHDQRGVNYLCSTALLYSTQNMPHEKLLSLCREHGISLNVEQHLDATVLAGKCFHVELPFALAVLSEIINRPAFEPSFMKTVVRVTQDMLHRDTQNPATYAHLRWMDMLCGQGNPFSRSTGRISDLGRLQLEKVRNWFLDRYRGDSFTLAIVGSDEPEAVLRLVLSHFDQIPSIKEKLPLPHPVPHPVRKRMASDAKKTGQAIIYLGGLAPDSRDHLQTTAFYLLAQILGGDMDSRLFNLVREKYGYAYQTGFDYSSVNEIGYWYAYAYCDPEDRKSCLRLMREVLEDVRANGVTETELLHAQNYLCGMARFERENASLMASLLASLTAVGYDPLFYFQREERVRSVDRGLLQNIAQNWLGPQNQWTYVLC